MRFKNLILCAIFLLGLGLTGLQAQQAITAAGGNSSGSGGSVSYSVGQEVCVTSTGINGSVAHGVQQPYEISVVTELEETKGIQEKISVFPNPAIAFLLLSTKDIEFSALSFGLFDSSGKLLLNQKVSAKEKTITMASFPKAVYLLKVSDNNKEVKIFTIIKN